MFASADSVRTAGWRKALVALLAGVAALAVAGTAQADPPWKKHHHHHHYDDGPDYVVVKPRYRAPRTVYVVPEPVVVPYYAAPMSYGPAYPPSLNLNFNVPLR